MNAKIINTRGRQRMYLPNEVAEEIGAKGCIIVKPINGDPIKEEDTMILEPVSIRYKAGTSVATVSKVRFPWLHGGYKYYIDMRNFAPETQAVMFGLGVNPLRKTCIVSIEPEMLPYKVNNKKTVYKKCFILKAV